MVFSAYKKQRILFYHQQGRTSRAIRNLLLGEGIRVSHVGVLLGEGIRVSHVGVLLGEGIWVSHVGVLLGEGIRVSHLGK